MKCYDRKTRSKARLLVSYAGRSFLYLFGRYLRRTLHFLQKTESLFVHGQNVTLVSSNISSIQVENIRERIKFYAPSFARALRITRHWLWKTVFSSQPILIFGGNNSLVKRLRGVQGGVFNIDYTTNPNDGWEWVDFTNFVFSHNPNIVFSRKNFTHHVDSLRTMKLTKSYIFGTGNSLEKALGRDWSDGYRVVCNTIVRDPVLWKHIAPHFIVAGDAIYHFGHTQFARAFREDLKRRLTETNTFFVYPDRFDYLVQREFKVFFERLIPIPIGQHQDVSVDLTQNFLLPGLGNVLLLLLLPLGCTLSKRVHLWGFDGRGPNDQLFWSNSNKHSYPEYLRALQEAHPRFFEFYVPKDNPKRYVKQVHGETLEQCLYAAEKKGFRFVMLHHSWTPTLQKRYGEDLQPEYQSRLDSNHR